MGKKLQHEIRRVSKGEEGMIQKVKISNSEVFESSIRILFLLSNFESKKTFKMTVDKIILYDFYMKFPNIMIDDLEYNEYNYNDYYSYFHIKPDREIYKLFLGFLYGKGLVDKSISSNDVCYTINENGKNVTGSMKSDYAAKLRKVGMYIKNVTSKQSDLQIENTILYKSMAMTNNIYEEEINYD